MPMPRTNAKQLFHPVERALRWATRPLRDAQENRRHTSARERIALVRHRVHITSYYRLLLDWMADELPQVRPYFELHTLPARGIDWARCRLLVPWVSENMVSRTPQAYQQLERLEQTAQEHGIATVNPVDAILRAIKLEASHAIAAAGVRTPHMQRIDDCRQFRRDLEGAKLPLLIRENRAHGGGTPSYLIRTPPDLASVPLERFEDPIAVEFIDIRANGDGHYRKYRYLAAGQRGVPVSAQIARGWEVRGANRVVSEATRHEESAFIQGPDPNHLRLQHVRRQLGLDAVAFDYSYTPTGELVVWEINVLPGLGLEDRPGREYLNYGLRRAMAALVELYLLKAEIEVPEAVYEIIATGEPPAYLAQRAA